MPGEVGAHLARGVQEQREVRARQRLQRRLGGVDGDVHRGDHLARAVAQRCRDRADAWCELFVGQGPAAGAYLAERGIHLGPRGLPGRLHPRATRLGEHTVERLRRQRREQHLSQRCLRSREAGADAHLQGNDLRHRDACDVDDVRSVQLCDGRRLAGTGHQLLQVRPGDVPEPERLHVAHPELQHPRGEDVAARVVPDVAERLQGEQDASSGRPGEAAGGGDLGQRHHRSAGIEDTHHVEPASDRLHEVRVTVSTGHSPLLSVPPGPLASGA